jgi:hypothetical protein
VFRDANGARESERPRKRGDFFFFFATLETFSFPRRTVLLAVLVKC